MAVKTKYFTDDGKEFETLEEANAWESVLSKRESVASYVTARHPEYTKTHVTRIVNHILGWEEARDRYLVK